MLKKIKFTFSCTKLIFGCIYLFLSISIAYAKPITLQLSEQIIEGGYISFDNSINNDTFLSGDKIQIRINMSTESNSLKTIVEQLDGLYLLIKAERIFDKQDHLRQDNNTFNSTVLTPSGLPIENYDNTQFFSVRQRNSLTIYLLKASLIKASRIQDSI
ncbi:MAG: hypothetical protein Q8P40_04635 [Nitrospirota bacterium]|nr:hypothetical protein [Nitrospirota bacterium]